MRGQPTELIRSALYDAAMIELSAFEKLPDTEHIFSSDFDKKIAELTNRKERKATVIIPLKRRVIAAIVAITMLISMTVTAVAFGEEIKGFFTEMYEKFSRLFVETEDAKTRIEERYTFSWIPEKYEITYQNDTSASISITEISNSEDVITFIQEVSKNGNVIVDTENAIVYEKTHGDNQFLCVDKNNTLQVCWVENGYSFCLVCQNDTSWDIIESLIDGMYVISEEQEE